MVYKGSPRHRGIQKFQNLDLLVPVATCPTLFYVSTLPRCSNMNQASASSFSSVPSPALLSSSLAGVSTSCGNFALSSGFHSSIPNEGIQAEETIGGAASDGDQQSLHEALLDMAASKSSLQAQVEGQGQAMASLSSHLSGVRPPQQPGLSRPAPPPLSSLSSGPGLSTLPSMGVTLSEPVHMVPPYVAEMAISGAYMDLTSLSPRNLPLLLSVRPSDADLE